MCLDGLGLLDSDANAPVDWVDPVNRLDPLARGLVGLWLCVPGATGGRTWVDVGGRRAGVLTNLDPALHWSAPRGRPGGSGCLDFAAASTHFVDLGTPAALELYSNFSAFAWVRCPAAAGGSQFVVAKDFSTGSRGWGMGVGSSGSSGRFYLEVGGAASIDNVGPGVADGLWHHIGFTHDGTTWRGYADGAEVGTSAAAAPGANADANTYVSGRKYVGFFNGLTGQVDCVSVHGYGLSAAGVRDLYLRSQQGFPGLVNRLPQAWFFDAGDAFTGTGDLAAEVATLAGTGSLVNNYDGTGDLAAEVTTLDGVGALVNDYNATGDLACQEATAEGSGTIVNDYNATGDLACQEATTAGTGTIVNAYVGTGDLVVQEVTVSGEGIISLHGTGALVTEAVVLGTDDPDGKAGMAVPPGGFALGNIFHRFGGKGVHKRRTTHYPKL